MAKEALVQINKTNNIYSCLFAYGMLPDVNIGTLKLGFECDKPLKNNNLFIRNRTVLLNAHS